MKDVRVVQASTALKITSVAPIRGFLPHSVLVMGESFQYAETVLYNGVPADEFLISSSTRLIVKIPAGQVGQPLNSVIVLSPTPLIGKDAVISFEIPRLGRYVQGMNKLAQEWLLLFMTTPGSDIFSPNLGGGGRAIIVQPTTHDGQSAMASLSLAVSRTKEQMVQLQARYPRIPPDEKLLSATLSNVRFDPNTTMITAVVDLFSMAGGSASLTVG
jgi:hypothetical protein